MSSLTEQQAKAYITKLLTAMSKAGGSDLFVSKDFPPAMKMQGAMQPMTNQKLTGEVTRDLANSLMNERQREDFARDLECNFAISLPAVARFRVNVFQQQQNVGMVIRTIANEIPDFAKLGLPETLKDIVMTKRGLVLVVGATGSGKSTSLAAMIDHRNRNSAGHIVTVEDPVEFVHQSSNLRAIISQRLVRTADGKGRRAAIEILINTPIIADKLLKGEFHEIKSIMGKSRELGMKTFDWSLFELYNDGTITYDEAIRNADSANELRLNIKLNSTRQPSSELSTESGAQPATA